MYEEELGMVILPEQRNPIEHTRKAAHITQYGSTVYIGIAMVYPH